MGCGGSREKETGVHAPLDHWMAVIGIEDVDQIFKDASETIKAAEDLREMVVDNMDKLILHSGACAYKEPTLKDCFMGICWKLSADNGGKFLDAGFSLGPDMKSLTLEGKKNSAEVLKAYHEFNSYISGMMELEEKITNIKTKGDELMQSMKEKGGELTEKVTDQFKSDIFTLPGKLKDIGGNLNRVTTAATCIAKLLEEFTKRISFLKELAAFFTQTEELTKIDQIGKKAFESKHVKAHEICWQNITDPKLKEGKKPDDGFFFWTDRIRRKSSRKKAIDKKD
jgi:hypothetical protein